uniref:Uncharacterized protein n=1 Tax=Manihot esculenta TaxID=3983 RepID=A0A2C9V582_MANES
MTRICNRIIQAKLVGDMGTGRTTLVLRFIREPTIGAAFFTQILSSAEATVKFDIWDTSEQERYHNLAPMYYSGSVAAIVMYDVSSMDTFIRVKNGFKNCKDKVSSCHLRLLE